MTNQPHTTGSGATPEAPSSPLSKDVPGDARGKIETHGIDVIPQEERHGRAWELFPVWFTGNLVFTYLLFGGILIQLGISVPVAIAIAVVGNLAWILVGVIATAGPKTGTTTMVVSRAQYGPRGNKLSCFFNLVICIGYEGLNIAVAALAAYSLADFAGLELNLLGKALILLAISGIVFTLGLYGHATIVAYQKMLSWVMGGATVLFLLFLLPNVNWSYGASSDLEGTAVSAAVLIGISVVLSGPLSYPIAADYSRYLPKSTSSRSVAFFTAAGGYIPTVLLTVTGILASTVVDPSDFTQSIRGVVPGWFYPIYLVVIIFGVISNSIYSVYSAGLAMQALGVPLKRSATVLIDGGLGTAIALFGVLIASDFLSTVENLLLWSIFWLAPFFGIYLVELRFSRGHYNGSELLAGTGRFWYSRGYRWRGVIALVLGMLCAASLSNTPYLVGPLSTLVLGGGDLSAVGGFVAGGIAYWLLCILPHKRAKTIDAGRPVSIVNADKETI